MTGFWCHPVAKTWRVHSHRRNFREDGGPDPHLLVWGRTTHFISTPQAWSPPHFSDQSYATVHNFHGTASPSLHTSTLGLRGPRFQEKNFVQSLPSYRSILNQAGLIKLGNTVSEFVASFKLLTQLTELIAAGLLHWFHGWSQGFVNLCYERYFLNAKTRLL